MNWNCTEQALFRLSFVGDENRKALLDLGAVDHLLRLIGHDDRIVRRNACMVFGLMTSNGE